MRVVFMGTPGFAVGTLKALLEAGHEVAAVVTQPDKPKGRGKELLMTPVKAEAVKHDIPVFQPERVRKNEEFLEELKKLAPDVIVVVAFGQLLPVSVLTLPKYGCVNVHASLLPMYRGAAPLQWVIINGEKVSGVTTMQMDKGLDTGDMLLKEEVAIEPKETYETYHDKLSVVGAQLLIKTLDGLEAGTITPVKQEGDTCYASMIDKSLGNLDFTRPAVELERLMRGLDPAPAAYSFLDGKLLKLFGADVVDSDKEYSAQECGIITNITKNTFDITTGAGVLRVNEVQLEGKKRMDAASFLRGCRLTEGTALKNSR
jgi:methionyl-tRNA formyltransferase